MVDSEGRLSLVGRALADIGEEDAKAWGGAVTSLDLTDNRLKRFGWLRAFPRLRELILDRNQLATLRDLPVMASVETLWLNNNALGDLNEVVASVARAFPNLSYLSMLRNPACPDMYFSDGEALAYARYRLYVIHSLPKLQFLDATPVSEEERAEAAKKGAFLRVARPAEPAAAAAAGAATAAAAAAASPSARKAPPPPPTPPPPPAAADDNITIRPAAFLAKGRLRYDGSHSEGNRFIQNEDL